MPRYGTSLAALDYTGSTVTARFTDGGTEELALVIGADDVHSHVRDLTTFAAYQDFLKPHVDKKQRDATRFAGLFVPKANS